MARIVNKELAEKIVKKLGAKPSRSRRPGSPHELYDFEVGGVLVLTLSLRRGSNRESGHDHIPEELHLRPHNASKFGQCNITLKQYLEMLIQSGVYVPPDDITK